VDFNPSKGFSSSRHQASITEPCPPMEVSASDKQNCSSFHGHAWRVLNHPSYHSWSASSLRGFHTTLTRWPPFDSCSPRTRWWRVSTTTLKTTMKCTAAASRSGCATATTSPRKVNYSWWKFKTTPEWPGTSLAQPSPMIVGHALGPSTCSAMTPSFILTRSSIIDRRQ
jgi:hypothetical protein